MKLLESQPKKVGREFSPRLAKVVTLGMLGKAVSFWMGLRERR